MKKITIRVRTLKIAFTIMAIILGVEAGLWLTASTLSWLHKGSGSSGGRSVIWCFGDSNMFGIGANRDESLARQLEKLLPGWKAINYGKPGSNTWMHRTEYEYRLKSAQPEIVLEWGAVNNNYNYYGRESELRISPVERIALKLRLYRVLRMLILTKFGLDVKPEFIGAEDIPILPIDASKVSRADLMSFLKSDLGRMKQLSDERNITLLTLTYPVHENVNETIKSVGESLGLNLVDNYPLFEAFPPINRHFFLYEDHHPNSAGYKLAALNVIHGLHKLSAFTLDPGLTEKLTQIIEQHETSKETFRFLLGEPLAIDRRCEPLVDSTQVLECWTYEIKASFIHLFWDRRGSLAWAFFRSPNRIDPNAWDRVVGRTREGVRYLLGEPHETDTNELGETWIYRHSVKRDCYRIQFANGIAQAQSMEPGTNPEDLDDLVGMERDTITSIYGKPREIQTISFPSHNPRKTWEKCVFEYGLTLYLNQNQVELAVSPRSISRSVKSLLAKGDLREEIATILGSPQESKQWMNEQGEPIRYDIYDLGLGKFMICYIQDVFHHFFIKYHTVLTNSIDVDLYPLLSKGISCEIVRRVWGSPSYWKDPEPDGGNGESIWIYHATGRFFMLGFHNGLLTRNLHLDSSIPTVSKSDFLTLKMVLADRLHHESINSSGKELMHWWFQLPEMKESYHFTTNGSGDEGTTANEVFLEIRAQSQES